MLHTKIFSVGSWKVNYLPEAERISCAEISEIERFLNREWLPAVRQFPSDENPPVMWAGLKDFKIPSPIIRVEMSPIRGGLKRRIYSIGKRPGLLGTLAVIARQFPEHRKLISEGLSGYSFDGFIQIGDTVQDDRFVAEKIFRLPYYTGIPVHEVVLNEDIETSERMKNGAVNQAEKMYYWVRIDSQKKYPDELLEKLESISLVPVRSDGCNAELIALKMARRLSEILPDAFAWESMNECAVLGRLFETGLPWGESFVVKPVVDTWGNNVEIYHIDDSEAGKTAVTERIRNLIRTLGPRKLMIQPYIPDRVVLRDEKEYHEIWRLYFVYLDGAYTFTGGMAQGSRSRKVCGIDYTYFIPLLLG